MTISLATGLPDNLPDDSASRPASPQTPAPQSESPPPAGLYSRWTELVQRIQSGDQSGMEELYKVFSRGIRYYLCRQLGPQELDDKVHDAFLIVVQAIQRGELREPDRLMGFVRTVVRRQIAAHIDNAVTTRRDYVDVETTPKLFDASRTPEEHAIGDERVNIMREVLREISHRDREILTRFYLKEQSQEQICSEMELSETQFRLLKSRAKARFGELGRKRLASRPLSRLIRAVTGE
ncbi:MAG: sigma-70 family RNA polymerase sigma factor [Bryobacterales bacterium]|nr:sigma-70 family RNA polymerase sigma factor [Bryobacterales bacterium]